MYILTKQFPAIQFVRLRDVVADHPTTFKSNCVELQHNKSRDLARDTAGVEPGTMPYNTNVASHPGKDTNPGLSGLSGFLIASLQIQPILI